jgi:antitoxin YefM
MAAHHALRRELSRRVRDDLIRLGTVQPEPAVTVADGAMARNLATLIAMSVSEQMPLADVKNRLSEVVDRLQREHGRVIITRHGHPAAVVMSVDDLESLEETLDVMDNAALLSDIRESLAELSASEPPVLTKDDALRLISGQ